MSKSKDYLIKKAKCAAFISLQDKNIKCVLLSDANEALRIEHDDFAEKELENRKKLIEVHKRLCPNRTPRNGCIESVGYDQSCKCQCGYMTSFIKNAMEDENNL